MVRSGLRWRAERHEDVLRVRAQTGEQSAGPEDSGLRQVRVERRVSHQSEHFRVLLVDPLYAFGIALDDHELLPQGQELLHDLPPRPPASTEYDMVVQGKV